MNPICPTGCETPLPIVSFDDCNPEIQSGEITKVYLANIGNPFTNVALIGEWTTRLSNTDTVSDASIRELTVIGDKPKPTVNRIEISGGRKHTLSRDHVINAEIDETNLTNHEFIRKLQCGGQFLMWYTTSSGKYIYGGNEGLLVSIDGDMVVPRGRGDKLIYSLLIEWKGFLEEADLSPMYAAG